MRALIRRNLLSSMVALISATAIASCSGSDQGVVASGDNAPAAKVSTVQEPGDLGTVKRLRMLTEAQYLNTIGYVFGPDVRPEPHFPPAQRTDGLLALGFSRAGVTNTSLELYQKAAVVVSNMVVDPAHRHFLIKCKPADEKKADPACASAFIKEKGRLLYRRPMTTDEFTKITAQVGPLSPPCALLPWASGRGSARAPAGAYP